MRCTFDPIKNVANIGHGDVSRLRPVGALAPTQTRAHGVAPCLAWDRGEQLAACGPLGAQRTRSRSHCGESVAFFLGKSTQMVVPPPAAQITPGWSERSIVAQDSKVVRAGSLT